MTDPEPQSKDQRTRYSLNRHITLGKLMGHKSVQTTARYAHLADDPLRLAFSQVGGVIADAIERGGGIEPLFKL
jgi:hypothetical protein